MLSVQEARVLQAKKQAADLALIQKRENRAYKRLQVAERNAQKRAGIDARKAERTRKAQLL